MLHVEEKSIADPGTSGGWGFGCSEFSRVLSFVKMIKKSCVYFGEFAQSAVPTTPPPPSTLDEPELTGALTKLQSYRTEFLFSRQTQKDAGIQGQKPSPRRKFFLSPKQGILSVKKGWISERNHDRAPPPQFLAVFLGLRSPPPHQSPGSAPEYRLHCWGTVMRQ